MRPQFLCMLLLGVPAIAACSDPEATTAPETTATSTVLSAAALESAQPLRLDVETRIGTLDGPEELRHFQVTDVALIRDEVWVLDIGDAELRVYGLDGGYRRTIGGRGEGPGEFQSPNSIEVRGDTVMVIGGSRLTMFGPDDAVLTTGPSFLRNAEGRAWGVRNAGSTWIRYRSKNRMALPIQDVLHRDTLFLHAGTPLSSEFGPQVFQFPTAPQMFAGERLWPVQPYFTAFPVSEVGAAGLIYYSPGDEYRIDIMDAATGALVHQITSTMELPPVTREMVDRAFDLEQAELADAPPGSERSFGAEVLPRKRSLEPPANIPIIGSILAAPQGGFVVQRRDLDPNLLESGDPSTWDLFSPEHVLMGRFVLPPRSRAIGFYGDRLVAVEEDEFDVPYVVVYRVVGV